MSTGKVDLESLKAKYDVQWEWFRQNSHGNCFEPRGMCEEDECLQQEFERRKPDFLALIDQMEKTPLPHYFCWAEAVFDEDDDCNYRLNPDTLMCVRVDGITESEANMILDASAFALRDELLFRVPYSDRVVGNSWALQVSELDFILLHQYFRHGFCPKHLTELFPWFPWQGISKKFDLELQEHRRIEVMNELKATAERHALRIRHLSGVQTPGDRFLANVIECSVAFKPMESSTTITCVGSDSVRQPQKSKRSPQAETIADKLEKLILKRPRLADSTAKELARMLGCSKSSVIGTPMWKNIIGKRGKTQINQWEDAGEIPDDDEQNECHRSFGKSN